MSKIEWTGKTWNPLVGCTKVSAGCKNCYAMRMAWRLMHNPKLKDRYAGTAMKTEAGQINWTGKINLVDGVLLDPLMITKPTTFFVNSMSDLFHPDVPFEFIDSVFAVMAATPHHTYQVLTKRPEVMQKWFAGQLARICTELDIISDHFDDMKGGFARQINACTNAAVSILQGGWPLKNVWLGVSVEDQRQIKRVDDLCKVPAAVRFLSCEPLLGPLNLYKYLLPWHREGIKACAGIHWVIAGGESGPNARPMHPDWVRNLRDQCAAEDVPFFFKQWGEYYTNSFALTAVPGMHTPHFRMFTNKQHWIDKAQTWVRGGRCISIDGTECKRGIDFDCAYPVAIMDKVGKKTAGRMLDGQLHNGMPNNLKQQHI